MPNLPLCHWSSKLIDLRAPLSTDVPVLLLNQPICRIWLATRAGEMRPPCKLGISRFGPARKKFTFQPHNRSFFDQGCSVKMAVYRPHSFLCVNHNYDKILKADWLSTVVISALIDFDFTSVHNYAKRTWPISSHIGQTLVNNVLRNYYHSTNGT